MGQSGNRFVLDKGIVNICIEGLLCFENVRSALSKQTAISLLAFCQGRRVYNIFPSIKRKNYPT